MQLSTASFYDNTSRRMAAMTTRATQLQTELATGKRIQSPSDAPQVAQQLAELTRKDADAGVYDQNMKMAGSLLDQADGVLGQITSQVQNALELATQAASGTQTAAGRKVIGNQLASIVQSITSLANTRDVRGQPLFGTPGGTPAVTANANGTFTYAATNVSAVPIADGQSVQATESASRIFTLTGSKTGATDALKMLSDLATALQAGPPDGAAANAALDDITLANDQIGIVQASVGARSARVELQQNLATSAGADRTELRSQLEDTDYSSAAVELQQLMTALSATQASFSKLSSLSLFDYIK